MNTPEPSPPIAAEEVEVETEAPLPWKVEQLQALGPVTGPSHRSYVPIIRSTTKEDLLGDRSDSSLPQTQLSFISEINESFKGKDSL
jgi:hypothetical protein